jgi:uncharacterized membrane protein
LNARETIPVFKKLLSLLGICQPAAQTPAANEAAKPKPAPRKITRKKRKANLASRQRHIKSERQRVARALQSSKASNKQSLDKANRFISGLYRRTR